MNTKLISLGLFLSFVIFISGCDKSTSCSSTLAEDVILGNWDVKVSGSDRGTVTLSSSGTGESSEGGYFETKVNDTRIDQFDWEIIDDQIVFTWDTKTDQIKIKNDIVTTDCDEFVMSD